MHLRTDLTKFNSIVTNLIKNAIKFTKEGEVSIGGAIKNDQILLWVKDTGIGIPKDRQDVIFDRFIQADINDKLALQGSGLGLAIIKAYVNMLGGKIYLESEEGIGSCFYVSLPTNIKKVHLPIEVLNTSSFNQKDINPELCLIIAEDDDISYQHLAIILEPYTKKILRAKDGEEVIDLARTHHDIQLILMDINMPKLNGLLATAKIREFNRGIVIIAQTAYALQGDKENALQAGCNDYVSKPIQVDLLLEMISKHVKNI
jgi:CheY-like chemotaxis protein/anti-sigma regulatory factor (Ser/Thr protein kinase)